MNISKFAFAVSSAALFFFIACGNDESDNPVVSGGKSSSAALSSALDHSNSQLSSDAIESYSSESLVVSSSSSSDILYGTLTDERDGKNYRTVVIGEQTWMAQNLNFKVENSFCKEYKHEYTYTVIVYIDTVECLNWGRFYSWAAAVGKPESECGYEKKCSLDSGHVQGACPSGWHLPDTTEWKTLFAAVGGQSIAGKKLKSKSSWDVFYENGLSRPGNGTDDYGFSAKAAGIKSMFYVDVIENSGVHAQFWSASETDSQGSSTVEFTYAFDEAFMYASSRKDEKKTVRCVKD